ncbi:unnamed protein product, partial [Ixodes hexagonus]
LCQRFIADSKFGVQKFDVTPQDTEVNPGDNVTLQCKVLNRGGDCVWLKDGLSMGRIPGKYNFKREPPDGDCSIKISDSALKHDDGSWQCQVTQASMHDEALASDEVKLVVREQPHPPRLEEGTSPLPPGSTFKTKAGVKADDLRKLRCVSGKGNPPASLRWFLGSQDVSHLAKQTNQTDAEKPHTWKAVSVLDHAFVKADNRKELKCVAYHSTYNEEAKEPGAGGQGHRDVAVTLNVTYPPEIKLEGSLLKEEQEGASLTLSCAVLDANPPADITWR